MALTKITRRIDSPSIREIAFDIGAPLPDFIVDSLCNWLEGYIHEGADFTDEQTIQYGFALLKCHVAERRLILLAPDYRSFPIHWQRDLAPTFGIFAAHKYVPETFGLTPDIPTLSNTAIVGRHFDELPMFADRSEPIDSNPNDSGWFIGSQSSDVDNNDPSQLRLMSLYEAIVAIPNLTSFLSLPVGCQVFFSGDDPEVCKDYEPLHVPKDSYVDLMFKKT